MKNARRTEEEVNAIVDEILDEDQENDFNAARSETCPRDCGEPDNTPKEATRQCKCAVENSSRFSLRVMEAMRSLQRDEDQPSTSSTEDIVDYIRANYRSDGDLYAQVRTALRQVCSQGYALELLNNEYHLIGPIVSSLRRNECSLDCEGRTSTRMDDTSGRQERVANNHRNGAVCRCRQFRRRNGPSRRDPRSPREESLRRTFISDRPYDSTLRPSLYSTRISANENNANSDYRDQDSEELPHLCDCGDSHDDRRQRDATRIRKIEQRDAHPIPEPSGVRPLRVPPPVPSRNAKRARIDDRRVQRADEDDDETITEEDLDCTCHPDVAHVSRVEQPPRRRRPRVRVLRNRIGRNGPPRENDEEDEDEEEERRAEEEDDEEERAAEEDDEEDVEAEEEDEDTEDSAYKDLRARSPRRTKARERELKRWIRRCRRECERRMRTR